MKKSFDLGSIDIESVVNIAIDASKAVMDIYEKDFVVEYKEDS